MKKCFRKMVAMFQKSDLKGFTDAWEQRKLGDIADIVGGGTPSTGNQAIGTVRLIGTHLLRIADQIYANSSQEKITDLGYENSSLKMLPSPAQSCLHLVQGIRKPPF